MSIVTKEWSKKFEEVEYLDEILEGLNELQRENGYTDEEMDNDLEVALWKAYVYNNMDEYLYYELSAETLEKVKDKGEKSGIWYYRYSCALMYLRRFEEALKYSRIGVEVDPDYPWGWLQLGRISYKFNLIEEAYRAIGKGLNIVPDSYEFLTLKEDIENKRSFAHAIAHYIDEEVDKKEKKNLIDIDDDELYAKFLNTSELEKKLDILHSKNKHKEVIATIEALSEEEKTPLILGKLARAYNNIDEYEKALEILLKFEDEEKNSSTWNYRVGYAYYFLKDNIKAEKYFSRALELNPKEKDVDFFLARLYRIFGNEQSDKNNIEKALEYYKRALIFCTDEDEIMYTGCSIAWAYDSLEKYDMAYPYLETAIHSGRDDEWIHSELGSCLSGMKKYEEAIAEYKKAIELGRNDAWIYSKLGVSYRELEKIDEALEVYLKGLEIEPNNIWINSELGWLYDNYKNDCNQGLKFLLKAKENGRDDIWINSELGFVHNHLGEFQEGLKYLEIAKKLGRDDEWLRSELGYCLNRLERYEEAYSYLIKNLDNNRDDQWLHSEIGFSLMRQKKIEEGLEFYLKTRQLGRDDIWINSEIGWAYDDLGKFEKALPYLERAEELGRDDEWLNSEIGQCLGRLGRVEEGIDRLKKSLSMEKSDKIWLNSEIGYLYGRLENSEEALKYLHRAEEMGRDDIWLNSEIGWNLASYSTKYEEALKYLNKVIKMGRDDEWIHGQLGILFEKMGKYDEAIFEFEKARTLLPYDSWILYHLGVNLRKAGKLTKALEILLDSKESNEYRGWIELELAWCYALIDEKEEAKKYLEEADKYIGSDRVTSSELEEEFLNIQNLIESSTYFA